MIVTIYDNLCCFWCNQKFILEGFLRHFGICPNRRVNKISVHVHGNTTGCGFWPGLSPFQSLSHDWFQNWSYRTGQKFSIRTLVNVDDFCRIFKKKVICLYRQYNIGFISTDPPRVPPGRIGLFRWIREEHYNELFSYWTRSLATKVMAHEVKVDMFKNDRKMPNFLEIRSRTGLLIGCQN